MPVLSIVPSRNTTISNLSDSISSALIFQNGLSSSIQWITVVGHSKYKLLSSPPFSALVFSKDCARGKGSPSLVMTFLTMTARTTALTIWDLRMSATRNNKQKRPSRWHTTAFLLKRMVLERFFGRESLAKIIPVIKDWKNTPAHDWTMSKITASGQVVPIEREPYPIVCCVSMENSRAVTKS